MLPSSHSETSVETVVVALDVRGTSSDIVRVACSHVSFSSTPSAMTERRRGSTLF
jgi:hypothetical protein